MLTDEILSNMPDDPTDAFIMLEAIFRKNANDRIDASDNVNYDARIEYISNVLASADELGISAFSSWHVPSWNDEVAMIYNEFLTAVNYFIVKSRIAGARKSKGNSVALDAGAKTKLRHLIQQMREIIDTLNIEQDRKDQIYRRIAELEYDIDRTRTGFAAIGALWISCCESISDGAEKLKPAVDVLERIAKIFSKAKRDEEGAPPQLPAPSETRKLEPPRKELPSPVEDDEIPF